MTNKNWLLNYASQTLKEGRITTAENPPLYTSSDRESEIRYFKILFFGGVKKHSHKRKTKRHHFYKTKLKAIKRNFYEKQFK